MANAGNVAVAVNAGVGDLRVVGTAAAVVAAAIVAVAVNAGVGDLPAAAFLAGLPVAVLAAGLPAAVLAAAADSIRAR